MGGIGLIGKALIVFGVVLIIVGIVLNLGGKVSWFGKLPGDIHIEKKNFSFYFPITTCVLISIVLTIVFWLIGKR